MITSAHQLGVFTWEAYGAFPSEWRRSTAQKEFSKQVDDRVRALGLDGYAIRRRGLELFDILSITRKAMAPRISQPIPIAESCWRRADRFTGQLVRALRARLAEGDVITLADGALLVPLRPGVEMHVEVSRRADIAELTATIDIAVDHAKRDTYGRFQPHTTDHIEWMATPRRAAPEAAPNSPWRGLDHPIPLDLPEAIEVEGEGVAARITFVPDLTAPAEADRHAERMLTELAAKFPT